MSAETSLATFENWTLRVRPPAGQPGGVPPGQGERILLMLHGWQGDENSMWIFARNFPADCWIVAPRAPNVAPEGGYTWSTPASGGTPPPGWSTIDNLRPAVQTLIELLDAWASANRLDASQVDVIGFSQGAALTFALGLLYPARVGKMGILAGFAPDGAELILAPGHFNGKKIFVAHGIQDERVPLEQARRSVRLLEGAGAQVIYCESEVGHKLSAQCMKVLDGYLA